MRLRPAAYASRDWLLGLAAAFSGTLRGGFESVRGLKRFNPLGHISNARQRFGSLLRSRPEKAGLKIVA